MKKFFRWAAIVGLGLAGAAVALPLIVRNRIHQMPAWYPHGLTNPAARRAAANSADQKLIETFSRARQAQAQEVRQQHASASATAPTSAPAAEPITLELSEQELNAFFAKWEAKFDWKEKSAKYVRDPVIVLEGQDLILAATVTAKDLDTLLSLHFTPRLADGKLRLDLTRIMAGTLPLPQAYFATYQQRLETALTEHLPEWRQAARIDPRGWANGPAVQAAMAELLLHALHDEPAEPALFLPEAISSHESRSLPVRVTDIGIANKTLTLTVRPMDLSERIALLRHIQGPEQTVALEK